MKRKIILGKSIYILLTCIFIVLLSACSKEVENEKVAFSINGKTYEGKYTGKIKKEHPIGKGAVVVTTKDDEWEYTGDFKDGEVSGDGELSNYPYKIEFEDEKLNGIYTGKSKDGLPNGDGEFIVDTDDIKFEYDGNWQRGKLKGKGKLKYNGFITTIADKKVKGIYEGELLNGEASGQGTLNGLYVDDEEKFKYNGMWKNNFIHGQGSLKLEKVEFVGNFDAGEFAPTKIELLESLSKSSGDISFKLSDNTKNFIENNDELFVTNKYENVKGKIDNNITYNKAVESTEKYEDKLMLLKECEVLAIEDLSMCGYNITGLTIGNEDKKVYINVLYMGKLENITKKDIVLVCGVPAATSKIKTVFNKYDCLNIIGSYVKVTTSYVKEYKKFGKFLEQYYPSSGLQGAELQEYYQEEYDSWKAGYNYSEVIQERDGEFYIYTSE